MKVLGRAETIQQIRVSTPRGHFRFIRLSASTVGTLALWKSGYLGGNHIRFRIWQQGTSTRSYLVRHEGQVSPSRFEFCK